MKIKTLMKNLLQILVNLQPKFIHFVRIAIAVVMLWIGGLKAFQYEADGIVPFVTNSPFMSFFYNNTGKTYIQEDGTEIAQYKKHRNPEGKMVAENIAWHKTNGTYPFSYGLGMVIVSIGILTLLGIWSPKIGLIGGLLTFGMSVITLSFLITTPEVYVPKLDGDFLTPQYGFPYLSGAGRLVLKDVIMMAAGLICASDCAKRILNTEKSV
ncbi:DUF417 domain-containing protein [Riemerella anatipestifer]|uniref:DUF417 domain-containing protein n=4 Tax=Riemerella anatipestifer TaxID=34085 RepID=H8MDS5_RIEAD|nr:hypothetical protein RA0C_0578 [Riemerella anatipestifer ATCC 11845 = DSM 15868]EFT35763.1 hypothetical protein RAYM_02642 [Riemerella anatipestifer RA-YM]MDD1597357.1 DUF417 domain-containing protein [Riemerella anatipestifer]MRM92189.1 DUF417 domain-containing protein [Riemerella anatipestifer]MRN05180.1 DUF417 domain-containing protein [Riemerella anatipestifer]